jgi:hypothetical protein
MRHLSKIAAALVLAASAALPAAVGAETASQAIATQATYTVGTATVYMTAGSSYKTVEVKDGAINLELGETDTVILRTLGPSPISLENTIGLPACKVTRFRENQMIINGPRTASVVPGTVPCSDANYEKDNSPALTLTQPEQGTKVKNGDSLLLMWSSQGSAVASVTLALSLDGGKTYPQVLGEGLINKGAFNWTVGDFNTEHARLRLSGVNQGAPVAFAVSPEFTIGEPLVVMPVVETPVVTTPATVAGGFDPAVELSTPYSVDAGVGYVAPEGKLPSGSCNPGLRVKVEGNSAVYYCGLDGKRHAFPNGNVHASWFSDFGGVVTVTPAQLANMAMGKPVLYRPGARMVKLATDPKVYAVAKGGELRWVETEAAAVRLYGANWNKMIDDVPDTFFMDYHVGESLK